MTDEYRYRVSMTCETHGGIHGYLYCPECTINALRSRLEAAEKVVVAAKMAYDFLQGDDVRYAEIVLKRALRGEGR